MYKDLRDSLVAKTCEANLNYLNDSDQKKFLFSSSEMTAVIAKTCFDILQARNSYLFSNLIIIILH